jgi:hypothetical protein
MGLLPDNVTRRTGTTRDGVSSDDRIALDTPFALSGEIAAPWLNRRAESATGRRSLPDV